MEQLAGLRLHAIQPHEGGEILKPRILLAERVHNHCRVIGIEAQRLGDR